MVGRHLVYGLRKLYQLFDKEELHLSLPSIKRVNKLPVVLSKQEVIRLLKAPERILEKVMFALTYDTGIRIDELTNLLISNVDLDRSQLHVRQSKNKKTRYITMSPHAVRGIKKHLALKTFFMALGLSLRKFEMVLWSGDKPFKSHNLSRIVTGLLQCFFWFLFLTFLMNGCC